MTTKIRSNADGTIDILNGATIALSIDANGKISFPQGRSSWEPGEIIQTRFFTDTGGSITTGSLAKKTGSKSITPKSTNSSIKVTFSFYGYPGAIAGVCYGQASIYEDTAGSLGAPLSFGTNASSVQGFGLWCLEVIFVNTTLAAKAFSLYAANSSGSASAGGISSVVVTLQEVQN